jgi:hypothetical protein
MPGEKNCLQGGVKCGMKGGCNAGDSGIGAQNEPVDAPELEQECEVRIISHENFFSQSNFQ